MKHTQISVTFVFSLFVVGVGIGIANVVYADSQKTQELQMHLDKVMNEVDSNNTQGAKLHLQGAQMMIASMNDENNINTTTISHSGASNNTG